MVIFLLLVHCGELRFVLFDNCQTDRIGGHSTCLVICTRIVFISLSFLSCSTGILSSEIPDGLIRVLFPLMLVKRGGDIGIGLEEEEHWA